MINTTLLLDGKKEVVAFKADDGAHELRFYQNDNAVIGEPGDLEDFDIDNPILVLKFTSKASAESTLDILKSVCALFPEP